MQGSVVQTRQGANSLQLAACVLVLRGGGLFFRKRRLPAEVRECVQRPNWELLRPPPLRKDRVAIHIRAP